MEYYNNLDVTGMTEAVLKMMNVYRDWGVDLFKDAFSLAGIAQKFVFRNLTEDVYFANFGQEHEHIYKELREKGITGGPSINSLYTLSRGRSHEDTRRRRGLQESDWT